MHFKLLDFQVLWTLCSKNYWDFLILNTQLVQMLLPSGIYNFSAKYRMTPKTCAKLSSARTHHQTKRKWLKNHLTQGQESFRNVHLICFQYMTIRSTMRTSKATAMVQPITTLFFHWSSRNGTGFIRISGSEMNNQTAHYKTWKINLVLNKWGL